MKKIICDSCAQDVRGRDKNNETYPTHWVKYEKDNEIFDFCSKKCLLDWLIKVVKAEARVSIEEE